MKNLTNTAELRMLDWINVVGAPARPTAPLTVALTTTVGTDAALGTEVVAGANAYARQPVTFGAAVGGAATNANLLEWVNMPGADVLGVEVWDSAGAPVRLWYGPIAGGEFTATNAGDLFTATAHGMANGTKVAFVAESDESLPAGLTANTVLYVVSSTPNTFQVSTVPGGAALALTSDGNGQYIKVKTTTPGDTLQLAVGALTTALD